ncbi:MAG: (d)CMP kinase [Candidatus Zixiibacteriota bacterium]
MSKSYNLSVFAGKIIAIDGPAGSGKSTTAKMLAERLGFIYLDTGAMYRAIAYFALKHDVDLDDGQKLGTIADKVAIEFEMVNGINRVYINGEDVTEAIRTPEVNEAVSPVAVHPKVREAMVKRQKVMGAKGNVVAEGRDTTSVVFPNADLKVYLDASIEERARRRVLEYTHKGQDTTIEEQEELLAKRDTIDSGRAYSPLTRTKDSILVDTSNLNIEEQVEKIITLMRTRLKT